MRQQLAYLLCPFLATAASAVRRDLQASDIDLFTCTLAESNFDISIINMGSGSVDPRYVEAFESAAARWSKVIVNDLQDFEADLVQDWFGGSFSRPYTGAIDDLVIGYEIDSIDGPGRVLGSAGPLFLRRDRFTNRPLSTISGVMRFDVEDFDRMPTNDVKAIILHEMGHVLGLVGTTGLCNDACDPNNPSQQAAYSCPLASNEYQEWAPAQLALENNGGAGTACGHWEEDSFRAGDSSEVMTGFFEANLFQPISRVTVAALQDLGGYEVDFCGADIWPATEETQQRFEVFRMNMTLGDMDTMMDRIEPLEELIPFPDDQSPSSPTPSPTAASSSSPTTSSGWSVQYNFLSFSFLLLLTTALVS